MRLMRLRTRLESPRLLSAGLRKTCSDCYAHLDPYTMPRNLDRPRGLGGGPRKGPEAALAVLGYPNRARMDRAVSEPRGVAPEKREKSSRPTPPSRERSSFYVWTAVVLVAAVVVVVVSWHARGGTADPTDLPAGHRLSHTSVVIDSAILVFREGLETILVLAAVMASFLGGNRVYRRPVAAGGGAARSALGVATWLFVVWLIGRFHGGEFDVQAATGIPSLIVLLIVMNWFFHKVYWTGWISSSSQAPAGVVVGRSGHEQAADAAGAGAAGVHVGVSGVF